VKGVLITGGSSGIGLATAVRLARGGARVAVFARNEEGLVAARERTRAEGQECEAFAVDVTDRVALERAVAAAAETLGGLDLVVVNVGAATYGRFSETPPKDFDRVVEVTFRGAVDTIRLSLPHLERSGGALVVVGSVAGELPLPLMSAYTAAKHALRGFVDALRVELRMQGSPVTVTAVEPGPVDTPFWVNVATERGRLPPGLPLSYSPEEVAREIERSADRRVTRATVGGAWVVIRLGYRLLRPLGERVLARLARLAERRGRQGEGRAAIHRPSGRGELQVGLLARPSLLVRLREATLSGRGGRRRGACAARRR
jgi:NAD(P)-dependent dehydrogenase (short-subunit alcohol dehydrogenase family)